MKIFDKNDIKILIPEPIGNYFIRKLVKKKIDVNSIISNGKILTKVLRIMGKNIMLKYDKKIRFLSSEQLEEEGWIPISISNKLYNMINNLKGR